MVEWSKFSGASWMKDNSGFFYSAFERPDKITKETSLKSSNYFHKIYFHKLGTPQREDALVFERPDDKELNVGGGVTDDGRYLVISMNRGNKPEQPDHDQGPGAPGRRAGQAGRQPRRRRSSRSRTTAATSSGSRPRWTRRAAEGDRIDLTSTRSGALEDGDPGVEERSGRGDDGA